jgi:hypothetical protein
MTIRTLWMLILRLLGVSVVFSTLSYAPIFIQQLTFSFLLNEAPPDFLLVFSIGVVLLTFFILIRYLIFFPVTVIDKLKLDQGYPESSINLNVRPGVILSIGIFVLGGILFVENLPFAFKKILESIGSAHITLAEEKPDYIWVVPSIQALLGYLLMTNSRAVAAFVMRFNKSAS